MRLTLAILAAAWFVAGCQTSPPPAPRPAQVILPPAAPPPLSAGEKIDALCVRLAEQVAASPKIGPTTRIAVMGVTDETERAQSLAQNVTAKLPTELFHSGRFAIVAKSRKDQVLAELRVQERERAAMAPETVKRLGTQLGVEALLFARITDKATDLNVECELVDIATNVMVASASASISKKDVPRSRGDTGGKAIDVAGRLAAVLPVDGPPGSREPVRAARDALEAGVRRLDDMDFVDHAGVDAALSRSGQHADPLVIAKAVGADIVISAAMEDASSEERQTVAYDIRSRLVVARATMHVRVFDRNTRGGVVAEKWYGGQATFERARFTGLGDAAVVNRIAESALAKVGEDRELWAAIAGK